MDGNGRWAKERGLDRTAGHKKGADVVRDITIYLSNKGVKYLTLYAFSTENWNRPKLEVNFLMNLIDKYLQSELKLFLQNNVRFNVIGDISKFSTKLQDTIQYTIQKTSKNTGLTQTLALNYGSKDEIIRAVKKLCMANDKIDEATLSKYLDTANMPEVDLLIRTSGEIRISNFLLWQCAYAEMFFTPTLWPDFTVNELDDIIDDFGKRERRFGGI
jgi:undecaprenyl diphosphate synthase